MFYFAIPPNVFIPSARAIDVAARSKRGWNRIVVEKPFGHDLQSALEMSSQLTSMWSEDDIYRIDHYLGKEIVQNLLVFRFGNIFLEPIMNNRYVSSVKITFKENFGTQGRGGYFDNYGIIRDIMQNHLMQVLTLVAMEPPVKVAGEGYSNFVRDAKVNVLRTMSPLTLDDIILGQYVANDKGDEGYLDDPTVPPNSRTPTFAQARFKIHSPRWEGVPFIMKAGKALDERKAEIRIQFQEVPGAHFMFFGQDSPPNELVMVLQPDQAVYFKVNVKKPGLYSQMEQSELDLSYGHRYKEVYAPDAYTRLILDTLRGSQATFVRSDELEGSWKIFDPLLRELEERQVVPEPYVYGSRGPPLADDMTNRLGVKCNERYKYKSK
jgi:glucose-6-phosphate 1-dehydrogenase